MFQTEKHGFHQATASVATTFEEKAQQIDTAVAEVLAFDEAKSKSFLLLGSSLISDSYMVVS